MDERSRHQLYQRLQEVLGAEEATTLMEHLPPGGVIRIATKDDLESLKLELLAEIHQVRADIHRNARTLTLSFVTIMAILNGIVFAALKAG